MNGIDLDWRRIGMTLLFPHIAVRIILLPVSVILLVHSMVFVGEQSPIAYVSYVISAYTLTIWCAKIPNMVSSVRTFRNENRYAQRWFSDAHLRVTVSLYGTLAWNMVFSAVLLGLGVWHGSFWFYTLAGYYICLALMRFFLIGYTRRHQGGEDLRDELVRYRNCGVVFMVLNLTLATMTSFMIYWNKTFEHNEITTIAMATFTFGTLAISIVNMVKYRKYNSPVYSASKAIGLAAACVSMIVLESTMINTFDDGTMSVMTGKILLGLTCAVVSAVIIGMASYMIIKGNEGIRRLDSEVR